MSLSASSKDYALLLELQYGDSDSPLYARYTNYTKSISYLGATFSATKGLAIRLPENTGTLDEKPVEIDLPLVGFIDTLTKGYRHSPVFVKIYERTLTDSTETVRTRFLGRLRTSTRCPGGKQSLASLECVSWKALLDSAVSMTSDHQCENTLGDLGCKINLTPLKQPGLLATINGTEVTITGLPVASAGYWHRGFIEYQGARISIRTFTTGTAFGLVQEPDPSWLGAIVQVTPGCDKGVETCRSRYNNEDNFNGVGYATPRYNPNFESP